MMMPLLILPRILQWRLFLSWLFLFWERLWQALWIPWSVVLGFIALSLLGGIPASGTGWHLVSFVLFLVILAFALWYGLSSFCCPDIWNALHRLERGHTARPLTALCDRPFVVLDPATHELWQRHHRQMLFEAGFLQVSWPAPHIADRDPLAIRAIPVLALAVGLFVSGPQSADRLSAALTPSLTGSLSAEIWITPPEYTRLPSVRRVMDGGTLDVPEGSSLLVLVHGPGLPVGYLGDTHVPFEDSGHDTARMTALLTDDAGSGVELRIRRGLWYSARQQLAIFPDTPPSVAGGSLVAATTPDGPDPRLSLHVAASDDYGVTEARLELRRPGEPEMDMDFVARSYPLPVPGLPSPHVDTTVLLDLAGHPWAGHDVEVRVLVSDGASHTVSSDWYATHLPERQFTHPVAALLASARKVLFTGSPAQKAEVWRRLDELSLRPDDFSQDPVVFLGLRIAALRLSPAFAVHPLESVADLLWNLALRIEDGTIDNARTQLEQARLDLLNATGDPKAVADAINAVRRALVSLLQDIVGRGGGLSLDELDALADSLGPNIQAGDLALEKMLAELEELTRLGAQDAARALAEHVDAVLSGLRNARFSSASGELRDMRDIMTGFDRLVRGQEQLLEDTFSTMAEGTALPSVSRHSGFWTFPAAELARRQESLRGQLRALSGQVGRKTGSVPEWFGVAGDHMDTASRALGESRPDLGQQAQGEALEALRQARRDVSQTMMQNLGQTIGLLPAPAGAGGLDPAGRPGEGMTLHGEKVPTKPERTRARDLLQELRRRAAEGNLDRQEQDYLQRLIRMF
ncbi:DUF4175 domain-containing protein [Haematospirillum jordaniae]|uniref:DUF4175 domain-containing protein n=1 Tax=Haematospirillum jordaniae TaxID=1549855 RepID=UPI001432EABB|nr:DUF4175 family protein [Haematospirillum jordaniae]NKD86005.1 DUF4175 domain-containing protein [Haematospirillum jordaniae]